MRYGRLDFVAWFFGCCLACFVGLTQAATYPSPEDAIQACSQALSFGDGVVNQFVVNTNQTSGDSNAYIHDHATCTLVPGTDTLIAGASVWGKLGGADQFLTCPSSIAYGGLTYKGVVSGGSQTWVSGCSAVPFTSYTHFPNASSCSTFPDLSNSQVVSLGDFCYNGCKYHGYIPIGSSVAIYPAYGSSTAHTQGYSDTPGVGVPCTQVNPASAAPGTSCTTDSDGDGIPDCKDPYPNDPANGDTGKTGTGNGSGNGNHAGGGGDCSAPPSCSGDAIACNELFQIWALRCNGSSGGSGGSGGSDSAVVDAVNSAASQSHSDFSTLESDVTSGFSQAHTDAAQAHSDSGAETSAINGLGTSLSDIDSKISALKSEFGDVTVGDGTTAGNNGSAGSPTSSDLWTTKTIDNTSFDSTGFGLSRSCPSFEDVPVLAGTLSMVGFSTNLCSILTWTGYLVTAIAFLIGARIIAS